MKQINKERLRDRLTRGWRIVLSSLRTVRRKKLLVGIFFVGCLFNVLLATVLFIFGFRSSIHVGHDSLGITPTYDAWSIIGLCIFYCIATVVNTFVSAVIIDNLFRLFEGKSTLVRDSLRAAWVRKRSLLMFGLLDSVVVYVLVIFFERIPFVAKLAAIFAGGTWGSVSFFALPVIMHNTGDTSPTAAVKGSMQVLKKFWKEGLTTQFSLGFILLFVLLIGYVLCALIMRCVYAIVYPNAATGAVIFLVGVIIAFATIAFFNLLASVARTALFYHITSNKEVSDFDFSVLKSTMTPNKAKKIFS